MARENTLFLVGKVIANPVISYSKERARLTIQTLRRNSKIDDITVEFKDANEFNKLELIHVNDFVIVKGLIATNEGKKGLVCPYCKSIKPIEKMVTQVIGISVENIGPNHSLVDLKEFSNCVFLLGAVCSDPQLSVVKKDNVVVYRYQLAVGRRFMVKGSTKNTDFPWIYTFGRYAEKVSEHLQLGSQIYLTGGIQTRSKNKTHMCPQCGRSYKAEDTLTEVVTYSVEYLDKCLFPDEGEIPADVGYSDEREAHTDSITENFNENVACE